MGGQDIARGLNPAQPISSDDMAALMRVLHEKVQTSIRNRSVNPLMDFVYSNLMGGAKFIAHIPVACGKGCSHCCNLWVEATPPEVLYTVKKMPPEQRQQAAEAVERVCSRTAHVTFQDRCGKVNPPCPLLIDHACSVYESRPLVCRTGVSTDADRCRRMFVEGEKDVGIPTLKVWVTLRKSYSTALEGALIRSGLAYHPRDWNVSLRIALSNPDAEARWLAGSDDFSDAPIAPAPGTFDSPLWRDIYQQAFGSLPAQPSRL